jgi:hypothetical protein
MGDANLPKEEKKRKQTKRNKHDHGFFFSTAQ